MGSDPSAYPKRWRPVFEWLLAELHQAGEVSARKFSRELSSSDYVPEARAA